MVGIRAQSTNSPDAQTKMTNFSSTHDRKPSSTSWYGRTRRLTSRAKEATAGCVWASKRFMSGHTALWYWACSSEQMFLTTNFPYNHTSPEAIVAVNLMAKALSYRNLWRIEANLQGGQWVLTTVFLK